MLSHPTCHHSNGEIVEAELISIEFFSTPRGERLYALFHTIEGKPIGIWTAADDSISYLNSGDRVLFRHCDGTKYEFVAKAN